MLRAMKSSGVGERITLALLALALVSAIAFYFANPYHSPLRDPRARLLGFLLYRQPSLSMEPTIPEGALFVVSTRSLGSRDPRPGEMVAFLYPPNPEVIYLKRVIAGGGSTVEIRGQRVYVDGIPVYEPYVARRTILAPEYEYLRDVSPPPHDLPALLVPDGQYVVLGDNRGNSEDSRSWGTVPRELMVGTFAGFLFRPGALTNE
jgi:signal peptidase I